MLTHIQGLQLLEFLIKNGSERVIDDARSHLGLLKMLRQFHFIDQNGKDQGVNVRNRSKELTEMLGDVDRIRAERKKARANRNKFGGVEGVGSSGGFSSGGSKYGGFGSEDTYGAYSGGVYGDGGGYGGNTSGFQDTSSRRDRFEEYDEFDEGAVKTPARRKLENSSASATKRESKTVEPPKKKEPEIDILGFDEDEAPPATPSKGLSNGKKAVPNVFDDLSAIQSSSAADDDFDDFQSAAPAPQSSSVAAFPPPPLSTISASSTAKFAAPKPGSAFQGTSLNELVGFNSISPTPSIAGTLSSPPPSNSFTSLPLTAQNPQQPRPTGYQAAKPNYFTSVPALSTTTAPLSSLGAKPSLQSNSSSLSKPAAQKSAASSGSDVFGSLWSSASAGAGIKKITTSASQGPNLASLAKEKAAVGMWGASFSSNQNQAQSPIDITRAGQQTPNQRPAGPRLGGGLDDLLG